MRVKGPIPDHILRLMPPEARQPLGKAGLTFEEASAKADVKQEKELQRTLILLLRHKGICVNSSRMDKPKTDMEGWPDLTFALPGPGPYVIPCAWEVKLKRTQPTPEQVRVMAELKANGWDVRIIRSVEEYLAAIRELSGAS